MLVIILVLVIQIPRILNRWIDTYAKKVNTEEYNLLMNTDMGDVTLDIIDKFIDASLSKYKLLNIECMNTPYITDEIQRDMIESTLADVLKSMSYYTKKKLYFVYNKDYIDDLILERIQMQVLDYTVLVNGGDLLK